MDLQMRMQQGTLARSRVRPLQFVPFTARGPAKQLNAVNVAACKCSSARLVVVSTTAPQQQRAAVALRASASGNNNTAEQLSLPDASVSVVLLAGGVGKRMGASIPKQYLELKGQAIATYSLLMFGAMREVGEVVIVCDPSWRYIFEQHFSKLPQGVQVKWAQPGAERQDSVFNGLQQVSPDAAVVAVHDSARPLVTPADATQCMLDGFVVGAAVLGVPVKPTIKEVTADNMVEKTLNRAKLWEVQTPQCIRPDLLQEGFRLVKEKGLEVTDDVSIIEAMGLPVKITKGSYTNIKVTTPDDMSVAEKFLQEQQQQQQQQQQQLKQQQTAATTVPEVQRT